MRVEAASFAWSAYERRTRAAERRAPEERRDGDRRRQRRAEHTAQPWISAPFGAYLLGQISPPSPQPAIARRAYTQPEARTPLRPSLIRCA
jgi:hypothetical protein